jgi:hypothetical protein
MKMLRRLVVLLMSVAVMVLVSSCEEDMETTSISERIAQLESDLNNNRAAAFENVHPDASDFGASRTPAYWDAIFPGGPYTLTISSISGDVAFVTSSPDFSGNGSCTFNMKEDGEDNWKIISADIPNGGSLEIQVTRDLAID